MKNQTEIPAPGEPDTEPGEASAASSCSAIPGFDYAQYLREATLKSTDGQPAQERADAMNLIEAIIEGDLDDDALFDAILEGTLPQRYRPL